MATAPTVYSARPLDSSLTGTLNIDFSSDLTLDHESEVPLLTLLSKLKTEATATNQFKFAVGRFAPRTSTCAAGVAAAVVGADQTIAVTAGTGVYFVTGDTIEVCDSSGNVVEATAGYLSQLKITSISTDNLVCRSVKPATHGAEVVPANAIIRRLFSAQKEGSSGTDSQQTIPTVSTQYCTSFEHYFDVTNIQAENRQYTGPERTRLREECRKKHALDQEYSYFLSLLAADTTTTGKTRYQMSGLDEQISSNSLSYGASLSDTELYDFMTDVHSPMYSGGMKRMVLASADLLSQVNKLATAALRITTQESKWGPNISVVQFAGRTWEFVEAPTLSDARPGWGFVIHPSFMKKRPLIETRYEMNVQNPIDKFIRDGFYSVNAIEVRMEEIFGRMKP